MVCDTACNTPPNTRYVTDPQQFGASRIGTPI